MAEKDLGGRGIGRGRSRDQRGGFPLAQGTGQQLGLGKGRVGVVKIVRFRQYFADGAGRIC